MPILFAFLSGSSALLSLFVSCVRVPGSSVLLPGLYAFLSPSVTGVHVPESFALSASGAPMLEFSALLSLSGCLPIPGSSTPSPSDCLPMLGLSSPGSFPPFSYWSSM